MGQAEHVSAERRLSEADVLAILPHRGPALFIGEAVVFTETKTGISDLEILPSHCQGHFPGKPIFPGHFWKEIAAQLIGVTASTCLDVRNGLGFLASSGSERFRGMAKPGDVVTVSVILTSCHPRSVRGDCTIVKRPSGSLIAEIQNIVIVSGR